MVSLNATFGFPIITLHPNSLSSLWKKQNENNNIGILYVDVNLRMIYNSTNINALKIVF